MTSSSPPSSPSARTAAERERVVVAGGSGFLGRSLLGALRRDGGYAVVNLSRTPTQPEDVVWDGRTVGEWATCLDGAAALIDLAGRSTFCRYTPANRREILDSRLNAVHALAAAVKQCAAPPPVWIQAGSLAFYGDTGDCIRDESAPLGEGLAAHIARLWENAFDSSPLPPGTRRVLLRLGWGLGPGGGPLAVWARLVRAGLGGTVGSGRQYVSWLHVHDLYRIVLWALQEPSAAGVYNATSPSPVPNAVFMAALRRALHRPWCPPIPPWAIRLALAGMGMEADIALTGRRCVPRRLTDAGFRFDYPDLDTALPDIFAASGREPVGHTTALSPER